MKYKILTIILAFSLPLGVYAEIKNKAFLDEMFNGCNDASSPDYPPLVKMIGVGGVFEYCGCAINELSKTISVKDAMQLGIEALKEGGLTDGGVDDKQLAIMLKNKQYSEAIVKCFTKVIE